LPSSFNISTSSARLALGILEIGHVKDKGAGVDLAIVVSTRMEESAEGVSCGEGAGDCQLWGPRTFPLGKRTCNDLVGVLKNDLTTAKRNNVDRFGGY